MQVPLNALYGSEDGECYDDVNAAVWQMYFNVAMKVPQRPKPPPPLERQPSQHSASKV